MNEISDVSTVAVIAVRLRLKCYVYMHFAIENANNRHIAHKQVQYIRSQAAFLLTDRHAVR